MTKIKRKILLVILLLTAFSIALFSGIIARAETVSENSSAIESEEIEPRGIYTNLTFSLSGEDGQVWGSVRNKFTLFPATVTVSLELYRSDTYQEDFANMTLVATNYIKDLDQGKTIKATASTNGKQSYWKFKAEYKIDSKAWQEKISDTLLFDANGNVIL